MFAHAFLPNLLIFGLGKLAAWGWLRTGMLRRGLATMVTIWLLADAALLARFAYDEQGFVFTLPLLAMQLVALAAAGLFCWGRLRRRYGKLRLQRQALFLTGLQHYMSNKLDAAESVFSRLRAHDPWDVAATIALANVLSQQGRYRRAKALYRLAKTLDVRREYTDFVEEQLRWLPGGKVSKAREPTSVPQ